MHNSRVDVLFLAKVFDQAERYEGKKNSTNH